MEEDKDEKLGWPEATITIVEYALTAIVVCFIAYCVFST